MANPLADLYKSSSLPYNKSNLSADIEDGRVYPLAELERIASLIQPYIKRTPFEPSLTLSYLLGTNVYVKMELFQKTGSFKPRGAFYQMLSLTEEERQRGVVAVSGGNFAQAVAYAAQTLGIAATICMPAYTPANYIEATKNYGAKVELLPDMMQTFAHAEHLAEGGLAYLHPYDSERQVLGCASLGLEIYADCPQMTDIFVSVGGGGLMAGVTIALKALNPAIRVWAVETQDTPTLKAALDAGQVVQVQPKSLARTLGAPYIGKLALQIAQTQIEELLIVTDAEAIAAQKFILERLKVLTELATACNLAAAQQIQDRFNEHNHVVLLLCGGNESLQSMLGYSQLSNQ